MEWFQEAFGPEYVTLYDGALNPDDCRAAVKPIEALLQLDGKSKVLDLCCGNGRYSIVLAEAGHFVTGLDQSGYLLTLARELAVNRDTSPIKWVHADMRAIPTLPQHDAVICMFNSFGYFKSDKENRDVLQGIYATLRPGGSFLLQVPNHDGMIRAYTPSSFEILDGGTSVGETRIFDSIAGTAQMNYTIVRPNEPTHTIEYHMRIYTPTELTNMIHSAGLSLRGCWATLDKDPVSIDSTTLVVVGHRDADTA